MRLGCRLRPDQQHDIISRNGFAYGLGPLLPAVEASLIPPNGKVIPRQRLFELLYYKVNLRATLGDQPLERIGPPMHLETPES